MNKTWSFSPRNFQSNETDTLVQGKHGRYKKAVGL